MRVINAQNANLHGQTAQFINVTQLNVESQQDTKQATQIGGGASISTSGAASVSASYENQDKQKVNQRSGLTFTGPVTGTIAQVNLTGADFTGGQNSTVKIDQMQGHDVHDYDNSVKVAASVGYNPNDPVPVVFEPNLKVDRDSGTHHAHSNLNADTKTNVVDDPSKAYEQTENTHWHIRFVLAALDMKQIKEAEQWWGNRGVKIKHFGPTRHMKNDKLQESTQSSENKENEQSDSDNGSSDESSDDPDADQKPSDDKSVPLDKPAQEGEEPQKEQPKKTNHQKAKPNFSHKKPLSAEEQKKQKAQKLFKEMGKRSLNDLLLSDKLDDATKAQIRPLMEKLNDPHAKFSGYEFDISGINAQNEGAWEQWFFKLCKDTGGKKILIYTADVTSQFGIGATEGVLGISLDDPEFDPYTHPGAFARKLGRYWDGLVKMGTGVATFIDSVGIAGAQLGGGIAGGTAITVGSAGTATVGGLVVVGVGTAAAVATLAEGAALGTILGAASLNSLNKANSMGDVHVREGGEPTSGGTGGPGKPGGDNGGNGNPGNPQDPKDPKGPNKLSGNGNYDKKPKNIPEDWVPSPSDKGGGTKYVNPKNPHDSVRVMPGNKNSPNPAQQNPYVKRMKNGKALDVNGNPVSPDSVEAHVTLDSFTFIP